ncbi:MAG: hypothetical protein R3Y58_11865 [Eubacteriales bacterium]
MKIVIETFVTVVFLTIMVLIASQLIGTEIQISTAKEFHANVVQLLEESDFNTTIIETCTTKAQELGYELDIVVQKESKLQCASCNTQWNLGEGTICPTCSSSNIITNYVCHEGAVDMRYVVSLPLLGIEKTGSFESYAR